MPIAFVSMPFGKDTDSPERGANLHLTLDDKREGLTIDFILSKESLEA